MRPMPKRPRKNLRFWEAVRFLIERFPLSHPVHVAIVGKMPEQQRNGDWFGCSWRTGRVNRIAMKQVGDGTDYIGQCSMIDTLLHEYAHLLSWSAMHDLHEYKHYHDDVWGIWYARLYRAWCKET